MCTTSRSVLPGFLFCHVEHSCGDATSPQRHRRHCGPRVRFRAVPLHRVETRAAVVAPNGVNASVKNCHVVRAPVNTAKKHWLFYVRPQHNNTLFWPEHDERVSEEGQAANLREHMGATVSHVFLRGLSRSTLLRHVTPSEPPQA